MSNYQHQLINGTEIDLQPGKVVCIGRNYADHAKELNNPVPSKPILFIKPATAIVSLESGFSIPSDQGECHHEVELSVLIGAPLTKVSVNDASNAITGLGIGLDLTLRGLQAQLKEKGHPWEIAKSFDGACPLSKFVAPSAIADLMDQDIQLAINGAVRQQGNTSQMLWTVVSLIQYISNHFTLMPGDVVLTGTPAGVGPLHKGDELQLSLGDVLSIDSKVL